MNLTFLFGIFDRDYLDIDRVIVDWKGSIQLDMLAISDRALFSWLTSSERSGIFPSLPMS